MYILFRSLLQFVNTTPTRFEKLAKPQALFEIASGARGEQERKMDQNMLGLGLFSKRTHKEDFSGEMNKVVPLQTFVALNGSHARDAHQALCGRPPFAPETMLRLHFLQHWFGLSDLAMEEALFETPLYRDFAGLSSVQRIPDRVSILRFRHLLEEHLLSIQILAAVNSTLAAKGLLLKNGRAIDATLIAAPSSTKNSRR